MYIISAFHIIFIIGVGYDNILWLYLLIMLRIIINNMRDIMEKNYWILCADKDTNGFHKWEMILLHGKNGIRQ